MAGDDDASANIEALKKAIGDAQAKANAGDGMFLVRANYLRERLAALTIPAQQSEAPTRPQSLRMAALNTAHAEVKAKTKAEEKNTEKNLEGDTQVTVVLNKMFNTTESFNDLAGASPHAPDRPRRQRRKKPTSKTAFIGFRIEAEKKAKLDAKAAAVELDLSSYFLRLADADLGEPIDEAALQRGRMLGNEIAALTVALNRQGNNFNQISKSAHEGKPCALSRPEISETLQQHTAAVSAILKLGFAS
jgi:hypothetical protein